jgi:chemotaxis protein CheD
VGIGQIAASADPGTVITALGLGSCVGVVMSDVQARVAGMAHVMLPESRPAAETLPGKFADTAVPTLLEQVLALGADPVRVVARLAGGAQMFGGGGGAGLLNVGARNAEAVRRALQAAGVRVRGTDVGGSTGRIMQVVVGTGAVTVRAVGGATIEL